MTYFIYIIVVQGHVLEATSLPTPTGAENRLRIPHSTISRYREPIDPPKPRNERSTESRKSDRAKPSQQPPMEGNRNQPNAPTRPEDRATPSHPIQRTMTNLSKTFCKLDEFNGTFQYHFIRSLITSFATKKKQITQVVIR